jgi:ParB family transcriptional regulator, chromosome partitioning protein
MTSMPISDIRIGNRIRRDLGDIDGLARNIEAIGLLCPLAVLSDGTLLAGARRLAAVKLLGWQEVPVRIMEPANDN